MFAAGMLLSNRYRLDQPLGEGGMGCVWSATDERMRRRVAVKLLKASAPGTSIDPEQGSNERRRLLREARAAAAVRHPSVVEVLDVDSDGDMPFLVMELLEGRSLRQHLDTARRMPCVTACALLAQVAAAVSAAHERGIVHRDLKPENIFLTGAGEVGVETRVKVLDFGIAKILHRAGGTATDHLTRSGHLLGSPPYMSPEQAFGEEDIDHRTDLWSLGIVLYECLSGILPTRADNTGQVFKIITKRGVVPIEQVAADVPTEIARLIGRLLAQDPARRPASMREVMAVLEQHARAETPESEAPRLPPLDSLQGLVMADVGGRPAPAPTVPPAPRRRTGALLATAGLMATFVLLGIGLYRSGEEETPEEQGDPPGAVTSAPPPPPVGATSASAVLERVPVPGPTAKSVVLVSTPTPASAGPRTTSSAPAGRHPYLNTPLPAASAHADGKGAPNGKAQPDTGAPEPSNPAAPSTSGSSVDRPSPVTGKTGFKFKDATGHTTGGSPAPSATAGSGEKEVPQP